MSWIYTCTYLIFLSLISGLIIAERQISEYAQNNLEDYKLYLQQIRNNARRTLQDEGGGGLKLIKKVATDEVSSLTVLGDKLFTLDSIHHTITVYNSETYEYIKEIPLPSIHDPRDILACPTTNSLYLLEHHIEFQNGRLANRSGTIWKTNVDWRLKLKWKVWKDGAIVSSSISISDIGNVLLAEGNQYKPDLVWYRPDGRMIKRISTSHLIPSSRYLIWHAMESRINGNIILSYHTLPEESGFKQWHAVVEVSSNGKKLINSFGNFIQPNSLEDKEGLGYPMQLASDLVGNVYVVDRWRDYLISLTKELKEEGNYIKSYNGVPLCVWFDTQQQKLLVGVYQGLSTYSEIYIYERSS